MRLMGRQFFIGDVHGCSAELQDLLEQFAPTSEDSLYQVGDLICKGPDSLGALRLAQKAGLQMVQGNHERQLLRIWAKAGGERTVKEQFFLDKLGPGIEEIALAVSRWPLWRELDNIMVVHAGLEPGKRHPREMSERVLTTIRTWDGSGINLDVPGDCAWHEADKWPWLVFFGHWALAGLQDFPHCKGLDTGCVYGKCLTGFCPQENKFYTVQAHREYVCLNL